MNVNVGTLDKKVQIVSLLEGYDPDGFPIKEESIVRSCWASVKNTSGSELIKSGSEFSSVKIRFLVRYTSKAIDTDMFVRYQGCYYDIVYVNDYNYSHEFIEIWCERKEQR